MKPTLVISILWMTLASNAAFADGCKVSVDYDGDIQLQHGNGNDRITQYMDNAVSEAARNNGCVVTSDVSKATHTLTITFREINDYTPFMMSGCGGLVMEADIQLSTIDGDSIGSKHAHAKGISECGEGARYEYKVWRKLAKQIRKKLSRLL